MFPLIIGSHTSFVSNDTSAVGSAANYAEASITDINSLKAILYKESPKQNIGDTNLHHN